jgi:hypothetical protein
MIVGRDASERTTASVPTSGLPIVALVAGVEQLFADRLVLALGPERVAPQLARDRNELRRALRPDASSLVVIDAEHPPRIPADELAADVRAAGIVSAVWGSDLPYGAKLVAAMEGAPIAVCAMGRAEGIAPLCDLVRSVRKR